MKIVKLSSENIKRLSAVEITPDGALITVGGKNGAGKSSVLDSIAYALGGEKLVPSQPIRKGEAEGKIVVDLDGFIITRRFYRDHMACDCGVTSPGDMPIIGDDEAHLERCSIHKFGPTKSTLTVTNRDGAKYPSPQAVLDRLLGKLTFDPLAFSREDSKKQNEILRRLVALDFTALDNRRRIAFEQRSILKKTLTLKDAKLSTLKLHTGMPAAEVPFDEVSHAMARAEELRTLATEAALQHEYRQDITRNAEKSLHTLFGRIGSLEAELLAARAEQESGLAALAQLRDHEEAAARAADATRAVVPDVASLQAQLKQIETVNAQVRANAVHAAARADLEQTAADVEKAHAEIVAIDAEKAAQLAAAQFPIPGLGLTDDGVTFESLPLAEVSSSVQLRVSIAIGLALNPTLKVLLIRNGNLLDEDSIKIVAEMAETASAQVWMEFVTSSADGVAVMLEDGHVA